MSRPEHSLASMDPVNAALVATLATARARAGAGTPAQPGAAAVAPVAWHALNPYAQHAHQLAGRQATACWRFLHAKQSELSSFGYHASLLGRPHAAGAEAASMRFEWVPATRLRGAPALEERLYGLDLTILTAGYVTARADGLGLDARTHIEFGEQLLDQSLNDWFAQFVSLSRQTYASHFPLSFADLAPRVFTR